jgi:hypothetical protein
MARLLGIALLSVVIASVLGGCVVRETPRCRYGWEPEHRDRDGRLVGGHCR